MPKNHLRIEQNNLKIAHRVHKLDHSAVTVTVFNLTVFILDLELKVWWNAAFPKAEKILLLKGNLGNDNRVLTGKEKIKVEIYCGECYDGSNDSSWGKDEG